MIYSYIAADNCYIIYQKQTILLPYFYLIKNMTICVINNGISPSTYISRRAWFGYRVNIVAQLSRQKSKIFIMN